MITGYGHFVQLADSLQWDETAIDLAADIEAWPKLEDEESDHVLGLLAGFVVGETSVAKHLGSFETVASVDDSMAGCFRSQARDEAPRLRQRVDHPAQQIASHTRASDGDDADPLVCAVT